jgi:hypothetical protein
MKRSGQALGGGMDGHRHVGTMTSVGDWLPVDRIDSVIDSVYPY